MSAAVIASAPLESIRLCLSVNGQLPMCNKGATPGFKMPTPPGDHADWSVTVIGTKSGSTPIVDVAFSWPTSSASLTVTQARFQGMPNPDSMRGFTAEFTARDAGNVGFAASWGTVSALATVALTDITKSPGTKLDQSTQTGTALLPAYSHAVEAGHTYEINFGNRAKDSGKPNLTATISFP